MIKTSWPTGKTFRSIECSLVTSSNERKVRAPQNGMVGNADRSKDQGQCNRKYTAERFFGTRGKGETVR